MVDTVSAAAPPAAMTRVAPQMAASPGAGRALRAIGAGAGAGVGAARRRWSPGAAGARTASPRGAAAATRPRTRQPQNAFRRPARGLPQSPRV